MFYELILFACKNQDLDFLTELYCWIRKIVFDSFEGDAKVFLSQIFSTLRKALTLILSNLVKWFQELF